MVVVEVDGAPEEPDEVEVVVPLDELDDDEELDETVVPELEDELLEVVVPLDEPLEEITPELDPEPELVAPPEELLEVDGQIADAVVAGGATKPESPSGRC